MGRKHYTAEQIIKKLREFEVLQSNGQTIEQSARSIGITVQSYYRWRKMYGGMDLNQAKRLKELETQNARLKRAVADLTLDNQILKDVSKGKF